MIDFFFKIKNNYIFNYNFNFNFFDFFNNFFTYFFLKNRGKDNLKFFDYFFFNNLNLFKKEDFIKYNFLNIILEKMSLTFFYLNSINTYIFFLIYLVLFLIYLNFFILKFFFLITEKKKNIFFKLYNEISLIFIKFFNEKVETQEEAFLIFKFVPFFLFLFFSHFFFLEVFTSITSFIEWNLPVIYGILIIFESIWLFSSHIFIYLNGSKTRKIFLASFFEDLINLFILITRILLQMVRGLIVSLYHDFFREISINFLLKFQSIYIILNVNFNITSSSLLIFFFFLKIFFFFLILTFTIILMFLQALFLFLAVWLFCRCWFISLLYYNIRIDWLSIFKKKFKFFVWLLFILYF